MHRQKGTLNQPERDPELNSFLFCFERKANSPVEPIAPKISYKSNKANNFTIIVSQVFQLIAPKFTKLLVSQKSKEYHQSHKSKEYQKSHKSNKYRKYVLPISHKSHN